MLNRIFFILGLAIIALFPVTVSHASNGQTSLTIAVASNFLTTARQLAKDYEQQTGVMIRLSSASSGKLTTQIEAGAPFDLFLSADMARPERLIKTGYALADSLAVYATGELVLVSRQPITSIPHALAGKVAVANPITAPYGAAAKYWLEQQNLKPKLIRGENINQTWHFFELGAVDVALVARSQASVTSQTGHKKKFFQQPLTIDTSILNQGMVVLTNSKALPQARAFHQFLLSDKAQTHISRAGYLTSINQATSK